MVLFSVTTIILHTLRSRRETTSRIVALGFQEEKSENQEAATTKCKLQNSSRNVAKISLYLLHVYMTSLLHSTMVKKKNCIGVEYTS